MVMSSDEYVRLRSEIRSIRPNELNPIRVDCDSAQWTSSRSAADGIGWSEKAIPEHKWKWKTALCTKPARSGQLSGSLSAFNTWHWSHQSSVVHETESQVFQAHSCLEAHYRKPRAEMCSSATFRCDSLSADCSEIIDFDGRMGIAARSLPCFSFSKPLCKPCPQ
jgi:hypothetical protein